MSEEGERGEAGCGAGAAGGRGCGLSGGLSVGHSRRIISVRTK
jgi:hypothetical protein